MEYKEEYIKGLLFEKMAGTISDGDNRIAEQAIADIPDMKVYWLKLKAQMEKPGAAAFLSSLDEETAWQKLSPKLGAHPAKPLFYRNLKYLAVAAMLLIGMPVVWYVYQEKGSTSLAPGFQTNQVYLKTSDGRAIELNTDRHINQDGLSGQAKENELTYQADQANDTDQATLYVPATKDYKIKLPDGTQVWLNSASTLKFPYNFNQQIREVYLTGEAYFEVAHEQKRKFVVHTAFADVQVHGTSFNVNAYDQRSFSTALVAGSVSAVKDRKVIDLKPGEQVNATPDGLTKQPFDAQELLSWRKGLYNFHNRSLGDIAQVLGRWFDVKVVFLQPDLAGQTFTGEINKSLPLEVVISNLELSSGIQATLKNGVLTFK
ncbi:FecR family protein [Pedobacter psychrotolerans]|uniref:FecR family protein n=1 Tax=Pedobacter psychrotolerans TaxID=1843235 RepID=UPI003F9E1576